MSIDKEAITLTLSISAGIVSAATFVVALAQMKIASAKTRLELYNKRFNIYTCALDYFQAAWGKSDKPAETHQREFIRCYRESQFLFEDRDGVYETLTNIKDAGAQAIGLEKMIHELESSPTSDPRVAASCREKRMEHLGSFERSLMTLEKQLSKYIRFERASGWHPFK